MSLQAYHGKQEIKDALIAQLDIHKAADEIAQGYYWENGRGCAVGCTIHGSDHTKYETVLGIPRAIARIEDAIFERLSLADAKEFPIQFANAIEIGADLSLVTAKFLLAILSDEDRGVINFARTERTKTAIQKVIDLYRKQLAGQTVTEKEWRAAAAAAAADAAAYAAAYAADAAADAAAYAAADAAYAAYAAAYAAAAAAARQKHAMWMRDVLLGLLRESKSVAVA